MGKRIFRFLPCLLLCLHPLCAEDAYIDSEEFILEYLTLRNDSPDEPQLFVPDQLATLTGDTNQLIGGVISPLSGSPCLRETDFKVIGAQPLYASRVYISPYTPYLFHKHWDEDCLLRRNYLNKHYEGWKFFPHQRLWFYSSKNEVHLICPNGAAYDFSLADNTTTLVHSYAVSNLGDLEIPSGKFDPKNTKIRRENNQFVVSSPDGFTRYYQSSRGRVYLLVKEILPNGKVIKYHYTQSRELYLVESLDPKEQHVYASIQIQGSPATENMSLISSTGLTSNYVFERNLRQGKARLKGIKFTYQCKTPPLLNVASTPQFRNESIQNTDPSYLIQSFFGKNDLFTLSYAPFGDGNKAHYRVNELLFPVGQNDEMISIYQMHYQPAIAGEKEGKTTINNGNGTSTTYHFSKNLLTTSIQYFGTDGALKKEKNFHWNDKNWLSDLELKDGNNQLILKKSYEYDPFGNPTLETFTGDLQGNGNTDSYCIKRTFSQDGRNLLTQEETEEGKITLFEYLPQTHLVTLKLIKDKDHTLIQESFHYDDCHNLIRKIIDGKVTDYILRQKQPFLHMPEWIEEKYLENGIEKLLKRTHLSYDHWGNISEEQIYDAQGVYAYTIQKEYNERGDILSETNPLGNVRTYEYDDRGRCIATTPFSQRLREEMHYDTKGRLVEQKEITNDTIRTTKYLYDSQDDLIQKINPFGNTFFYHHDPLTHEIIRTDAPTIITNEGSTTVVTFSTYDAFGRETSKTDPNGHTTYYRYNAYGLPTQITYPNGSQEIFRYTKQGKIAHHTNKEGLTTTYTFDLLGRIITKNYGDIGQENYKYDSFNLLEETDLNGHTRHYSYDGANRKIKEEASGRITNYAYNSLGQLAEIAQNNLKTCYKRDLEGKVLEESKLDHKDTPLYKISYTYNTDGDLASITRYINNKKATETITYDPFRRKIKTTDPYSQQTTITYNENHTNSLGQRVLQTTTHDPKGILTITTHDPFDHPVREETINPQGNTIASWDKVYDPNGNVTHWKEHLYENGHYQNTQCTHYTYTNDQKIASSTRAFGTPHASTTTYTYTPGGKVCTKTPPDGIQLSYTYNELGYLHTLKSSDGSINHHFTCTKKGELTRATDEKITIQREIDPFGNVTKEIFPNITIQRTYDDFDRIVSLQMAHLGTIQYNYDPLHLRSITRLTPEGKIQYTHHYDHYDLDGNLLTESMICEAGQIKHKLDKKGRKVKIDSPYFKQTCQYDACDNLIKSTKDKTPTTYAYDDLSQLISENANTYRYDSLFNRREKNDQKFKINPLNELTDQKYDLRGNQIQKGDTHYTYDPLNRLIEATVGNKQISFQYDPLGRRLSKIVRENNHETYLEHYIYNGVHEIGALENGTPKNIRVLGLHEKPIAIELNNQVFVPLTDFQGNICRLVDPTTKEVTSYTFTAFGEEINPLTDENPWRYAAKRFDPELNLIYFGKRYYDPALARWLTTDPAGFADSLNLYQYAFNNPNSYYDPNGEFVWAIAIPFAYIFGPALAKACVDAIIIGAVSWGIYEGTKYATDYLGTQYTLSEDFCHDLIYTASDNSRDSSKVDRNKKKNREKNYPGSPKDLENNPDWQETTHPGEAKSGRRVFENTKNGDVIEYDKGKPNEHGHKANDHYHRRNPNQKGNDDEYLDKDGKPCPKGSGQSHLHPPEGKSWS